MKLLKGSIFLKALALLTAVITYVFINNEMYNVRATASDPSYKLLKLTAKSLPLKVRLGTEPPEGYRIVEEGVVARPSHVIVIGPEALFENAGSAETALIDVSENTKTVTKRIPLESVAGTHVTGAPYSIEVTVPIRRIEAAAAPSSAAAPAA